MGVRLYIYRGYMVYMSVGMMAGGSAAVIGNPTEVSLVRMTLDGRLPVQQRRGYKNVFDAMFRIVREEGVLTLWRVSHQCIAIYHMLL